MGTGCNRLTFTTSPTTIGDNGGILPYATVTTSTVDFATYNTLINTVTNFTGYASRRSTPPCRATRSSSRARRRLASNKIINALLMINGEVGEAGFAPR